MHDTQGPAQFAGLAVGENIYPLVAEIPKDWNPIRSFVQSRFSEHECAWAFITP